MSNDYGYVAFVVIIIRFFPLELSLGLLPDLVPHVEQELLTFPDHLSSPPLFTCLSDIRVVHVVKLYVFTFLIPCCDVCYDFRAKTMFRSC